jgi:hypothetical protein
MADGQPTAIARRPRRLPARCCDGCRVQVGLAKGAIPPRMRALSSGRAGCSRCPSCALSYRRHCSASLQPVSPQIGYRAPTLAPLARRRLSKRDPYQHRGCVDSTESSLLPRLPAVFLRWTLPHTSRCPTFHPRLSCCPSPRPSHSNRSLQSTFPAGRSRRDSTDRPARPRPAPAIAS